ncbi:unnamed protein product [Sphagnum troendelagicum]|uniref:AAA+ ATPase domain-containing protein n=1 Tax=Sphagnum troendelagicum TaxID=128251 RepID=A0ABP0US15_9BRYO
MRGTKAILRAVGRVTPAAGPTSGSIFPLPFSSPPCIDCTIRRSIVPLTSTPQLMDTTTCPCFLEWMRSLHKALTVKSFLKEGFVLNSPPNSRDHWKLMMEMAAGFSLLFGTASGFPHPSVNEKAMGDDDLPSESKEEQAFQLGSAVDTQEVVQQVRSGVDDRIVCLKLCDQILPPLTIAAKGQQVSVRFPMSPTCDVSHLIVDVVSRLGEPTNDGNNSSEMVVRAWDSAVARQLTISSPGTTGLPTMGGGSDQLASNQSPAMTAETENLCVLVFEPLLGGFESSEVEFLKKGFLSSKELDAIVSSLSIAGGIDPGIEERTGARQAEKEAEVKAKTLEGLEAMGVKIYGLENNGVLEGEHVSWDNIAGYHDQKREIEDMVLLALKRPEVYDSIARGTRRRFESNRPRAILFEGPPGTGKTSCARVIASQAGVPLLYVPLEVVVSKYYGESERLLASIFTAGNELPEGAIIFLDEIDSMAMTRDGEMHEATRRMLSVLLRQMDGFEQDKRIVVIAATNRKQDLDPALLSRFDTSVAFNLPDQSTREEIASQYARHLTSTELKAFGSASEGMSGRDIHDVCQQAERRWASKVIRGLAGSQPLNKLPPLQEYLDCAKNRQQMICSLSHCHRGNVVSTHKPHFMLSIS